MSKKKSSRVNIDDVAFANELIEASETGNIAQVRELCDLDGDKFTRAIDLHDFRRWFSRWITRLDTAVIAALVDLGVSLNQHDNHGYAPDGIYPLNACILREEVERAKFLLELGADANQCNGLFTLCSMNKKPELRMPIAELLISFGADVNQGLPNIPGYTPLGRAMDSGHQDLVEFLISKGAVLPVIPDVEVVPLDLATFQTRLEEACAKCWQDVQAKFPEEKFCLFGLETDSDFVILNPLFDSEGAIDRDIEERRPSDHYVARVSLDSDAEFYGQGCEHLGRLSTELNSQYGQREGFFARGLRIRRLRTIFEAALKRLDQQGLFGTGSERERIILLLSIIDADHREWNHMLKIAKRLNPPKVFEAFKKTLAM